jgi:hypothetical protein
MTILSNGNVGVGTTTPWTRFSIAGTPGGLVPLFAISTSTAGFATSTAFVVNANGLVGIGTTSPRASLEVNGHAIIDNGYIVINNNPTVANFFFGNDDGYDITSGAGNMGIGLHALQLLQDGINNTAIGWDSQMFNITGDNNTSVGEDALKNVIGNGNTAFGYTSGYSISSGAQNTSMSPLSLYNVTTGSYNVALGHNAGYGLQTNSSSNVLVGYGTYNSTATANNNTVVGYGAGYYSTGSSNVFLGYTAGLNETNSNRLYIDNKGGTASTALVYGVFDTSVANQSLTVNGNLGVASTTPWGLLSVNPSGISGPAFVIGSSTATNVIVTNVGRVGINTTAPNTKFEIKSSAIAGGTYASPSETIVRLNLDALNTNDVARAIEFYDDDALTSIGHISVKANYASPNHEISLLSSNSSASVVLGVNNTEYFRVNKDGNIGVATTSPWRKFSVTGTVALDGLTSSATGNAVCITTTKDITDAGGASCVPSSIRFKENVETLSQGFAITELDKLHVVSFDYKPGFYSPEDSPGSYGMIAEEVEKIDPKLVDYGYDGKPLTLKFEKLLGLAIQAIQELSQKVSGFAESITTGVLNATDINGTKLCLDGTCITKTELQRLLDESNQQSASSPTPPPQVSEEPTTPRTDDSTDTSVEPEAPAPAEPVEDVSAPTDTPPNEPAPDAPATDAP